LSNYANIALADHSINLDEGDRLIGVRSPMAARRAARLENASHRFREPTPARTGHPRVRGMTWRMTTW